MRSASFQSRTTMTTIDRSLYEPDIPPRLPPDQQGMIAFRTDPEQAAKRKVRRIDWRGARMRGLEAIEGHLVDARLSYADLSDGWLGKANLSQARLVHTNLSRTNLVGANLQGAVLSEAVLIDADLIYANLRDTSLADADLTGAKLQNAILANANLMGANLSGADFISGGVQSKSCGLTQRQLDSACADPDCPPLIEGLVDAETAKPLVWRGKACNRPQ